MVDKKGTDKWFSSSDIFKKIKGAIPFSQFFKPFFEGGPKMLTFLFLVRF